MYFILGFVDDKFGLSPRIRLICQSLISSILLLLINPIRFSGVIIVDFCINLGILVLFINAINFWDGMNGLSGCTAILYGILLFGAGFVQKNHYIMILSAMLVGGTIPFLIKNMPEGKIFLGDGGAYYIAFVLYLLIHMAVASISSMTNKSLAFIFFLNVPFYDAVFACFRRIKNKINITMGDRSHLYDLLIKRGSSSSQVIMILISLMSAFGTAALLLYGFPDMTIIAGFFLFCFYVFISIKLGSLRII
jgi:UDP-GlcNAc:undecaprenyl-phosphate GlcNAc-1-phosphate transferase